jgi:Transposase/Transposase IS116/IS110/IS902 family
MTRLPTDALAAFIGLDWAEATHDLCLHAAGSETRECSVLEHQPDTLDEWVSTWRARCKGPSMAICLELNTGPLVSALRTSDCLVRLPVNPLTLARSREAFAPSQAQDDPTDAALPRDLLLTPRDQLTPLQPQSPTMRALEPLVEPRRRLVGDHVRLTNRLTRPLNNDCPPARPWFHDQDTTICCDFLTPWPTLKAVPLARRSTLERFCRDQHGRDAAGITQRLHAIKSATPLTTDEGVLTPNALLVQALVAQLRVTLHALEEFDQAMAQRTQRPPDCPVCAALPGAGAVLAPPLLVAFGAHRARSISAAARQTSAGLAPVTERSGHKSWVHWRLQGPTFVRHTCVEWAAESTRPSFWARASDPHQRDKGASPQAAVRALACKWLRILLRCWQHRTPYDASISRKALKRRGSPLLHHLAKLS